MERSANKINRSPQRHFISYPLIAWNKSCFMVEFDRMLIAPSNKKGGFYEVYFKTAL